MEKRNIFAIENQRESNSFGLSKGHRMGPAAIPFILKDLQDNGPNHWFWALQAITDENPVSQDMTGNIAEMTEAWLEWGRKKGYLKNCPKSTSERSQI